MSSNPLNLPPLPSDLKPILGYLKTASDHEKINPVVAYWTRLYACQVGLGIDKKAPDCVTFLTKIMGWLEKEKAERNSDEAIFNEMVAQAHIENYAIKLFEKADSDDREGKAGRNTIKLFFTASQLFETLAIFGEPSEEVIQKSKYSKWRAAYISKCLKNNEVPLPPNDSDQNEEENEGDAFMPSQNTNLDWMSRVDPNIPPMVPSTQSSTFPSSFPDVPQIPSRSIKPQLDTLNPPTTGLNKSSLDPEAILKAQKYCKYAGSALQYEDISTAVQNLEKALALLKTGEA